MTCPLPTDRAYIKGYVATLHPLPPSLPSEPVSPSLEYGMPLISGSATEADKYYAGHYHVYEIAFKELINYGQPIDSESGR